MGEGGGLEPLLLLECRCFFSCCVAAGAGVGPGAAACRQCQEYGPSSICYCPLLLSHADNLPGAQYPGWFPACASAAAFPASFTAAADAAELLNLNLSDLACCLLLVLPLLLLVVLLTVLSQISSCICCQETRCLFCNAVAAAIVLLQQLLLVALVMVLQLPPLPLLLLLVPNHFASACAALWSCDCIVCLHK